MLFRLMEEGAVARKPTDTVKLQLRLDEALRRQLERAARANDHSMNSEIIHRLERSFHSDRAVDAVAMAMELESTDERNWKDDRLSAETVRIGVDRIIAAFGGLPREHPHAADPVDDREYDEETERLKRDERVPHKDADALATVVARKFGLKLPTEEQSK